MELKIIHFYPDLMSLYGSYANVRPAAVSVLRRPGAPCGAARRPGRAQTSPAPTFSLWEPARVGPSGLRRGLRPV